jgi:hypothetical protein
VYPQRIALHTAPGRAVHLQKNVRLEHLYEVVDSGVGTARFTDLAPAEAFFAYLKGEQPMSRSKPDAPPLPLIAAIPGVQCYYDYGRWHIALRSRLDEDRLVYISPAPGVVPDGSTFTPIMACFSTIEAKRRGLDTWSAGVWAAGAKFIFPAVPVPGRGADTLNHWGATDFVPYAEATLAHNLGLVEAIDAEAAPHPGVRAVLLRGGVTAFVRRSTPLGTARAADGSWRLWLGDGEGWRPASGPNDALWKAVAPVCFGTPVTELTDLLPGAAARAEVWEVIASSGDVIPAAADAVGDILMMANIAGDILCFVDDDIPDEDDREAFDAWTIFTAA